MPNISYVFTVNPGRNNLYTVPGHDIEVKAISAGDMEVQVVDGSIKALIMRNDIRLGVSVILGKKASLQFYNPRGGPRNGYVGGVIP